MNSLTLKNTFFPSNLVQGPLAGISCAPFRYLTWKYSQPAFTYTEMISCKTLIHQSPNFQQRFIKKDPEEGPVCFQLAANNAKDLTEAVKRVTAYGADLIDLNCGCPVKKIRNKGAGSSLLLNPSMLYQLISAMRQNTHLPISIKIRVEGGRGDKFNQEIANVVSEAGLDFLTVHGRHWTEHYETPCHYADIQFFVEALKIPVIGNGDVACVNSLKKMLATGCQGVMIGRAGVGQPWLIQQLTSQLKNEIFTLPSLSEMGAMFVDHVERLSQLLQQEKFAVLQARKFAKYYARYLPSKMPFCAAINSCDNLHDIKQISRRYFSEGTLRVE